MLISTLAHISIELYFCNKHNQGYSLIPFKSINKGNHDNFECRISYNYELVSFYQNSCFIPRSKVAVK